MSYRLGVDVGGTFTDLMLFDESSKGIALEKVPTTVSHQAVGIIEGIRKITEAVGIEPADITMFLHGTTAATNAILEHKGVSTALITTKGFADVLHIMRQNRPLLYDFFAQRPLPLVPRDLRFEVSERVLFTGEVDQKLNEAALKSIIRKIRKNKVQAVAVCLLHGYANPVHEEQVRQILQGACPDVYVSISSEVLPEIREYERMSTTVINVYVLPIVHKYLDQLLSTLRDIGLDRTVHVMQSSGGITPSSMAGQKSACTILSGPAAGVLGGVALAKEAGLQNAITIDMGGTSFDICLARNGAPKFAHQCEIAGHVLKIPMIDIHAIGAGGGSIAWIDRGGILKVGPQSAGADPGPACYGKGGNDPTVTDANLVLNRLNPDFFLGGEMEIDARAAHDAIDKRLARPLGMEVLDVAEGIIRIVNASMVKGIRYVSVEKGHDPREFGLVCFGGNGPMHAVELARELDIRQAVIPFAPGVNCAYGLLVADFRYDYVQTHLRPLDTADLKQVNAVQKRLDSSAYEKMADDGIKPDQIVINRSIDLRYMGQGYEIEAPLAPGRITRKTLKAAEQRFHELHKAAYGFSMIDEPTQIVNLRVACVGHVAKPKLRRERLKGTDSRKALKGRRDVFLSGKWRKTSIYDRSALQPGAVIKGPAVVEQKDSTTLLLPGDIGRIDGYRNIIIDINGGK